MPCRSLLLFGYLLVLALDLAMLLLILLLILFILCLVELVLCLEALLGGLISLAPHLTNDLGQLSDLGIGILTLYVFVYFASEQEEPREWLLGWCWLSYNTTITFSASLFLPIYTNICICIIFRSII